MMIELSELQDAAQKAFPADGLVPDRDVSWKLIAEMGWLMIDLPEADGGLGLGRDALATILFEQGRVLSTAPLIPALLALQAIVASPDLAGREDWIGRICGGEYVPLNLLPGSASVQADGTLAGRITGVFEADMASHVLAGLPGRYVLIPNDAPGVTVTERPLWDRSRRLFDIALDGFRPDPALVLAEDEAAARVHDRISPAAMVALAADSLGGASAALDLTVEYLKTRRQFDRPLAMFQALKHRCADLKTHIASAEALLWSRCIDDAASNIDLGAMKAMATDTYFMVVEEMIQLHGGIGLTEEHQSHLFLKRALLNMQLCGSADNWREAAGRQALAKFAG
ncbi:MAG: acyl-CoA/acyl-ACP dehydrogenase [Sphingomonadales bacterium]|nr:acyl-CoA/acyl-ACP dehydrogenase [Sphingomonadales bacterium]